MKKWMRLLLVALMAWGISSVQAGGPSGWDRIKRALGLEDQTVSNPPLRVLVLDKRPSAVIEITGNYNIFNPATGDKIASRFGAKHHRVTPTASGVKWGELFPGVYQIEIAPDSIDETSVLVDGIQYRGNVVVYQVNDQLSVVNKVPVEDYVKSVMAKAAKEHGSMGREALSAMTIVARTNAIYQRDRDKSAFWHIKASEVGYDGLAVTQDSVDNLVDYTKGLVMAQNGTTPFAAVWTEDSAGKTAPYQVIFRHSPGGPDTTVEAPFAAQHKPSSSWQYQISKTDLAQTFSTPALRNVEVFKDSISGKVYGLRLEYEGGSKSVDFLSLQEALGTSHIQSSDFNFDENEETVTFNGYGKGHGVGLCLYSANKMAEHGREAPEILAEFFPGMELRTVDPLAGSEATR